MNDLPSAYGLLKKLTWSDLLFVAGVLVLAWLIAFIVRWAVRGIAEKSQPRVRLFILRLLPISRLLIAITALVVIVPVFIEPKFKNIIVLIASGSLAMAFAFKDYGSCLVAGLITVFENTYQPGDWIEVDGIYGEVKVIDLRSVRIVTPDDTEVIIPHSRIWSTSIFNASSGNPSLLCVADFYLHPDHDASVVRKHLADVAETSVYRKPETAVTVVVFEKPWGTHYRLKAYVKESRDQFQFISDLTVRGKEVIRSMRIGFAQAVYAQTKI